MKNHRDLQASELHRLIKNARITLAGNRALKIYGMLACSFGKRMKKENRIFFTNESEAVEAGYRPCGHCLKLKYARWKHSKKQVG
jgi:methylphosphotriester-DNA--protein-cysteine methyltransferase